MIDLMSLCMVRSGFVGRAVKLRGRKLEVCLLRVRMGHFHVLPLSPGGRMSG